MRSFSLAGTLFILMAFLGAEAQERQQASAETAPELRRQVLVLDINTRVTENEHEEIWAQSLQRIAIPGSPVTIRLVGSNIVVAVQFTPFIRRRGSVLVAHGQIWINDPNRGISYYTSIQTIPMEFNEPIYFFPLGASQTSGPSIEIIITIKSYRGIAAAEEAINKNEHGQ